jgi:hypothetical protein
MSSNRQIRPKQYGGASASDFRSSSMARYVQPGAITKLTLAEIDQAPMFHPLEFGHKIPMGYVSTGIIPEGIYYMNQAARQHCSQMKACGQPSQVVRETKTGREKLIDELKKGMRIN